MKVRIYSQGNGFPEEGETISQDSDLYTVQQINSTIFTSSRGDYIWADIVLSGDATELKNEEFEALRLVRIKEENNEDL